MLIIKIYRVQIFISKNKHTKFQLLDTRLLYVLFLISRQNHCEALHALPMSVTISLTRSSEQDTNMLLSLIFFQSTLVTASLCPVSVATPCHLTVSHTLTDWSSEQVAMCVSPGDQHRLHTSALESNSIMHSCFPPVPLSPSLPPFSTSLPSFLPSLSSCLSFSLLSLSLFFPLTETVQSTFRFKVKVIKVTLLKIQSQESV